MTSFRCNDIKQINEHNDDLSTWRLSVTIYFKIKNSHEYRLMFMHARTMLSKRCILETFLDGTYLKNIFIKNLIKDALSAIIFFINFL